MGKISSELEAAEVKKQTLRKTLEQIHSSSSSFLLFSLQWKDLEDHFDTARRFLLEQVQGLESKEKRFEELELREKRVEELSRGFEAKEERLRESSKEFELKEVNLEERVREVESREERIEECSRDFEVKEKRYGECIRKLEAKEKRLGECLKEFELKEKKIEELSRELELRRERIEERSGGLGAKEEQYAERIRELEVKEDGLKESWKQLEEWNQVFELREKKIEERLRELEAKEKQFKARFKGLELREEGIELRLKDIGLKEKWYSESIQELEVKEKRAEEIMLNENKLGEKIKELELKEKLLEVKEDGLKESWKELEEWNQVFELREKKIEERFRELEMKDKQFKARFKELELREESIELRLKDIGLKEKWNSESIQKLEVKEKRAEEIILNENKLGERIEELELKEKLLEVKEDGLKESWKELEEWNQVFELREKKIEERFRELEAKEKQFEARFKELELREESIELRLKDIGLKEKRSEEIILNENKLGEGIKELELKEKLFEKRIKELELREKRFADSLHTRVKTEPLEDFPVNNVVDNSSTASLRFCVTMDGKSLQIFLNERWKEHDSMRLEVGTALGLSSDPAKLVLDAMEGFYPPRLKKGDVEFDESIVQGSCVLLLEQLLKLSPSIKPDVKQEAMRLAIEWRAKMRVDTEHSLEVLGFLQLLASYGLASAFDDDELIMYLEKVSENEQLPGLCQILGVDNMAPVSCTVHSHVKSGQLSNESSLLDSRVASLAVNPQQDPKCLSVNVHGETLRSLLNKQVEYDSIRSKVSDALQSVLDPDKLVLDAIMGIYPLNLKGDEGFKLCVSRNFILLLKQLIGVSPQIKPLVKVEATKFANDWKSRLKKKRDDPLEVLAFLQFLVAYGLASSFYANEVLRLLDTDVWCKKIPDLCRVLGLTDIMPNFIQNHIKEEQQLEAIKYICALELVDNFPLVTLLNDHLKNSKRKAEDLCKEGNKSLPVQLKGISKELTALRAVLSWIEIYKLEDENFHEILVKHIAEQEKQQAEKKREYDSSNVKNGPRTRSKDTLLQQHQQQQTNCSPKTLGSEMDPQQTNQVRPQHTEQKCTATTAPSTLTSGNAPKSEPQEHSGSKRRRTEVPREAPPIYAVGATSAFHSVQPPNWHPPGLFMDQDAPYFDTSARHYSLSGHPLPYVHMNPYVFPDYPRDALRRPGYYDRPICEPADTVRGPGLYNYPMHYGGYNLPP